MTHPSDNDVIIQAASQICDRVSLDQLAGTSVVVTGASGLIGTHFLACLAILRDRGVNVRVQAWVKSEPPPHLVEIAATGGFQIVQANLADFAEYSRIPEADVIIHAAGYAQPLRFMANAAATLQINTAATLALLQRVRPGGHFLFVSSSEVYAGLREGRFAESDIGTTTPYHPRASYIEGKRSGEAACFAYRSQGVHATSVRLGDVYGPGTRPHDKRALNSFIERALCQRKIELLDAGTAVRTYCYVADAVELLWQMLLHGEEAVYNAGGRSSVSIAELATIIGRIVGVPVTVPSTHAEVAGAPAALRLDLTKTDAEFHKTIYVGLEEGLGATIEWQRELYSQPRVRNG